MRVLMTTDCVGGVWTFTRELTGELLRRGAEIALAVIGPAPSATQKEWLHHTSLACQFHWQHSEAPLEWMSDNDGAHAAAEPLLLQMASAFRPDLLHSNQLCFGALPVKVPRLVVAHSDVFSWAAACRGGAMDPCRWLDTYDRLTMQGLAAADCVVAPTQWMLTALAEHYRLAGAVRVIRNGRTLAATESVPRKLQAVSAGRLWDEAKNAKLLRDVQAPFPILMAGEASSAGHLTEEELLALFRESAIYLCTSVYEPFGLAPLEAALCGCAVLANDIPSLREVWGNSALYFEDAATLSCLLAELARDPQRLAEVQRRCRQQAQRYTTARMADEYLALYQIMIAVPQESAFVA